MDNSQNDSNLTADKTDQSSLNSQTRKKIRKSNKLKPGHARREALQMVAEFESKKHPSQLQHLDDGNTQDDGTIL